MKKTARAHSNIAFVKYWGKKDDKLRLPSNGSISMNLSNLHTTTTVEFDELLPHDIITINGEADTKKNAKVAHHLDRIRNFARRGEFAKVVSVNNFPTGVGLSSSATGFAALTVAALAALDVSATEKEISILARLGSGSACRSIPEGFTEWKEGTSSDTSYAVSLYPPSYWDLVDIVALTSRKEKDIPTTEGQKSAQTSPFFKTRLSHINDTLKECREALHEKDFTRLGMLIERDALEMHSVMLTSVPPLLYWLPETVIIMKKVIEWRREGLEAYFTINTGQNVHIICRQKDSGRLTDLLKQTECVHEIITNTASKGTYLSEDHLF